MKQHHWITQGRNAHCLQMRANGGDRTSPCPYPWGFSVKGTTEGHRRFCQDKMLSLSVVWVLGEVVTGDVPAGSVC